VRAAFVLADEPLDSLPRRTQRRGGSDDRVCAILQLSSARCPGRDRPSVCLCLQRLFPAPLRRCGSLESWGQRSHPYLCGGQGGFEGFGGGSHATSTVTVTVSVGLGTVVVTVGPGTVVVTVGPGTVVVTVGPGTVVVTVGPGLGTVSVLPDTIVVTTGPETVVVVVEPGTVTNAVVAGAVSVLPGAPGRVAVSPVIVTVWPGAVSVTTLVSPLTGRSWVVQTTLWRAPPTVPWAIIPIAPTPTR
jgi:hypothetical protein